MTLVAGSKIYETCGKCGKLVQINKWLFGSLHVCRERIGSGVFRNLEEETVPEKEKARRTIRKALAILKLPPGVDDDEHCCYEECGVRLGSWVLCYVESADTGSCGMFLYNDDIMPLRQGEFSYEETGIPKARHLAKWLRGVLDEHNLWEELR